MIVSENIPGLCIWGGTGNTIRLELTQFAVTLYSDSIQYIVLAHTPNHTFNPPYHSTEFICQDRIPVLCGVWVQENVSV